MKRILALLTLALLTACHVTSPVAQEPLSAATLTGEYEASSNAVRGKYDGQEITVRGYTLNGASLPRPRESQGSVLLSEKGNAGRQLVCWFSAEQAAEFSKVKASQYITVKGVFSGEVGVELKFCKLVKLE